MMHTGGVPMAVIDEMTDHSKRGSESYLTYIEADDKGREMARQVLERLIALTVSVVVSVPTSPGPLASHTSTA